MKKIQNMLSLKPDAEKLNLSFLQIETLDDTVFELSHFENLKEVDLSCNRLRKLPSDLSILKTIERLDLTNNLFDNIESVLTALNTMPALKELNITYDAAHLPQSVMYYLPRLDVINGEVIKAGGSVQMNNPITKVTNGRVEVEQARSSASLLNHGFLFYEDELVLLRHFHQNVYTIIQDGNNNPKGHSKAFLEAVKNIEEEVKSTYDFNDDMTEKAKDGTIVKNIETYFAKRDLILSIMNNFNAFLKEKYPKISSANENILNLINLLLTNFEKQASHLQEKVIKDDADIQQVASVYKVAEAPPAKPADEIDPVKTLLRLKLAEIEKEVEELRRENDDMYKFLINSSKKDVLEYAKKVNKNSYTGVNETRRLNETQKGLNQTQNTNGSSNLMFMKSYTIRQINSLIYDILLSKKAYDEKCLTTKAQPETLEGYLFIYFKHKYGLKDMILVEVSSVIEKIKSFADKSIEVETFKRILKNEIDEKFFWLLQSIRADFKVKLEQLYKDKVKKNGSVAEAAAFAHSKFNGGGLEKEEGEYLITLSYRGNELKSVQRNYRVFFEENCVVENDKPLLAFTALLEYVFKLELEKHLEHLRYVSEFFNKTDDDKNGVITKKQFLNFLDVFAMRNVQVSLESIVKQSDSNEHNRITFSKMIEVLSANFADKEKQLNLIQFLNKV